VEKEVENAISLFTLPIKDFFKALTAFSDILVDPRTRPAALQSSLLSAFVLSLPKRTAKDIEVCGWNLDSLSKIEEVRKAFREAHVYSSLFSQMEKHLLAEGISFATMVSMITRDPEGVIQICKEVPSLFSSLPHAIKSLSKEEEGKKTMYAGMLLVLLGHSQAHPLGYEASMSQMASSLKDEKLRDTALTFLMYPASTDASRHLLVSMGFREILIPLAADKERSLGSMAGLVLALLAASDDGKEEEERRPTPSETIDRVLDQLRAFDQSAVLFVATFAGGFYAECKYFLIALRSIATNEANLKQLREKEATSLILDLFKNRRDNLLLADPLNLEEV